MQSNIAEPPANTPELSVVMPCLNEADTIETCIRKALQIFQEHQLSAEVVIGDNGSTDGSVEIAEGLGARVVHVAEPGYGNALMGGIAAARGTYVIMGDADDSYDFLEIPKFVEKLREGYDLVQGCRLPWGGGTVLPGAMPFTHRWIGNPLFSRLARWWFKAPIHDIYCGMRGFTKKHYLGLEQRCTGMEFATENIIKSSLYGAKIAEVPITLHPDGRIAHPPHLKTMRDGWRTLRFFLLYCPRILFLLPGLLLILLGGAACALGFAGIEWGKIQFDVHTLLYGGVAVLAGFQAIGFGLLAKTFAVNEGLVPEDRRLKRFFEVLNLERGLVLSLILLAGGLGLMLQVFLRWKGVGFADLDYPATLRVAIPGVILTALALQGVFSGFLVSMMGLRRK